ncbi:hypothetical protein [Methanococcoides sp. FTZ1]|uniref:hypothetical protein n=1 Tax=Methanococcoides sp. FTZ1 TaxID=3439061 RepID=UPI003F8286C9
MSGHEVGGFTWEGQGQAGGEKGGEEQTLMMRQPSRGTMPGKTYPANRQKTAQKVSQKNDKKPYILRH